MGQADGIEVLRATINHHLTTRNPWWTYKIRILKRVKAVLSGLMQSLVVEAGDLLETGVVYANDKVRRRLDELFVWDGEAPAWEGVHYFGNGHWWKPVLARHHCRRRRQRRWYGRCRSWSSTQFHSTRLSRRSRAWPWPILAQILRGAKIAPFRARKRRFPSPT